MSRLLPLYQAVTKVAPSPRGVGFRRSWAGVLLVVMGLAIASPALAQEQFLKTLTVTGQGVENIEATLADVRMGVEAQGPTAAAVQQEVARRSDAVVKYLRSQDVDKLQTTGISLNPQYDYSNNQRKLVGYQGSNIVSFQVPSTTAGGLLDQAVEAGASRIDGIAFKATDAAIAAARQRALKTATQDAQSQAQAVFSALNITPKDIVGIQVNGASAPSPHPVSPALRVETSQSLAKTPIIGGEQAVNAAVTLQIQY